MSNSNNSRDTNRRVRRRLNDPVPFNLTNVNKNAKWILKSGYRRSGILRTYYTNLPREIALFTQLETLYIRKHKFTWLPKEIGNLKNLKEINLSMGNLESLPPQIGNLKNLEELKLEGNKLRTLPKEIGLCKNLKKIDLDDNMMESLPKEIGNLKKLETIYINGNKLTSLPKEISLCKNLKELNFGENRITSIPKEIGLLKNLEDLGLDDNKLTSIPKEIGLCKNLKTLNFGDNKLTSIPKEIEDLPKLSKLNLRGNPGLKGISSELKKNGLNIWKNTNTKFINYKYYTNQLSTVTVKRKNLPRLPPKIRENIARKVNTKPNAKTEANKMNVARSSLKAYNNKQKVLTRRAENLINKRQTQRAKAQKARNIANKEAKNLYKINNNFITTVSKVHNTGRAKLKNKMESFNVKSNNNNR
jgi:Leucine-rich repeat (LRR) protein